ncbi:class I SAM-dependent methyltransferase [bacterium]|nr:class I SAM-dependent methyltransferase [bacterium]
MKIFEKLETLAYRNIVVPFQGRTTFNFVNEHYKKGMKVLDFGCGTGSNSKLFHPKDYIGSEVNSSRVESSSKKYPKYKFKKIPIINSLEDKLPWENNSFDIIFVSLCLHHINAKSCKIIFKEFRRVLKNNGKILGIEPALIDGKYFSNILMNILDAGDYILPLNKYKDMYESESFTTTHINVVKTFGYNLWQYSSVATDEEPTKFKYGKTQIRKITKPIHLLGLYGKWVMLIFLGYKLIDLLVNMFSSM